MPRHSLRGFRPGGFKGSAAAAASHGIGVLDSESGAGQVVGVIDRRTLQKIRAVTGDNHFHPIALDDFIALFRMVEAHAVLQTGTAAPLHANAQPFGLIILLGDDGEEAREGGIGDVDHGKTS